MDVCSMVTGHTLYAVCGGIRAKLCVCVCVCVRACTHTLHLLPFDVETITFVVAFTTFLFPMTTHS